MEYLALAAVAQLADHMNHCNNTAIKLLRLHNETIEALNRHRRGGEQRVIVQHVADKMAVVTNYGCHGGERSQENKGASSCTQENAKPEQKQQISHVEHPPFQEKTDADCMVDSLQVLKPKKAAGA